LFKLDSQLLFRLAPEPPNTNLLEDEGQQLQRYEKEGEGEETYPTVSESKHPGSKKWNAGRRDAEDQPRAGRFSTLNHTSTEGESKHLQKRSHLTACFITCCFQTAISIRGTD
jgi:hypothetical protein